MTLTGKRALVTGASRGICRYLNVTGGAVMH